LRRSEPEWEESFLREVPEVVESPPDAAEWERDRTAWNLPRAPREVVSSIPNPPRRVDLEEPDGEQTDEASH
jgi:hypothetical protein